ncbi:MAG: hypothetical protein Q9184_006340 [Pyrenodesmia sp. 2 TL-2023]
MHSLLVSAENGFTLLQDAKIYALARYLELPDLKRLAFHNIQDTLSSLYKFANTMVVTNVMALAQYTYAHTDSLANSEEPLRKLVSTFVASKLTLLAGPEFDGLMAEGGEFAVDVMNQTQRETTYQLWKRKEDNSALKTEVHSLKRKIEEMEEASDDDGGSSDSDSDSDSDIYSDIW